jgi:hypothetical protein
MPPSYLFVGESAEAIKKGAEALRERAERLRSEARARFDIAKNEAQKLDDHAKRLEGMWRMTNKDL